MNYLQRIEYWGEAHHPKWVDVLRIALGVFLFVKGIEFANNMSSVTELMAGEIPFSGFMLILIVHYILGAHILGGFLLTLGLLTRFACILQIPVLLGAIIFVNSSMVRPFSELILAIIILLLLIYFLVVGSGPWSIDRVMEKDKK